MENSIYQFQVKTIDGKEIRTSDYKGRVLIVVNTASKCGFTLQFEGLEALYQKYKKQGLLILGFPCNQFLNQDPGSDSEINEFCKINYGVSFPMFAKVDVNGKNEIPLYSFLKREKSGFLGSGTIKWNFTKFLIDREGHVVKRFASKDAPEKMTVDIEKLL